MGCLPSKRLSEEEGPLTIFERGFLVGLLVGEGYFGGHGRSPVIALKMHTDHAAVFAWLTRRLPGGHIYGPYEHNRRRYLFWFARGRFLRETLVPLLDEHLLPIHSRRVYRRYQQMKARYELGSVDLAGLRGEVDPADDVWGPRRPPWLPIPRSYGARRPPIRHLGPAIVS
jgi:hypothetical protein